VNNTYPSSGPKLSLRGRINQTIHSFSLTGAVIFYTLLIAFGASALSMVWKINNHFMTEVPARGGAIVEGIVGLPRYINPVLAVTDGDKDLTSLIYSGLLRHDTQGELILDIAEDYFISTDGKVYTFTLKDDVTFHDGERVTADDVVFTISKIQDANVKSPKRANWAGVLVSKVDERTVTFTLPQAYAPFIENATIGILPKHLWENTTPETFALEGLNTEPIGSGPYILNAIKKDRTGSAQAYELTANRKFILGTPHISSVIFKVFDTENELVNAYRAGEINSVSSLSPEVAMLLQEQGADVHTAALPRVFGVFFNQDKNEILASKDVRRALDISVDRTYITNTVLQGFGTPLSGPVPEAFIDTTPNSASSTVSQSSETRKEEAQAILEKAGWVRNANGIREKKIRNATTTLSFSITTSDAPELKQAAEIVKSEWQKIGADVTIKVYEGGQLNQDIIRPRQYESLLFGQIVNKELDLYAFWHSSQREDPGLNISLYNNPKADTILEALRTLHSKEERIAEYEKLATLIASDIPAVFLYSPELIHIASPKVHNITLRKLTAPSERFDGIYTWYVNIDRVWQAFAQK
jgi:peptide/nickel transport system substrate-binding protein